MNAMQLLLALGIAAGLLAILIVVGFGWLTKRFSLDDLGPRIDKTVLGGLGIGNIAGPNQSIASIGRNKPAHMSLDTVIMTPTNGLRFLSLGCAALLMYLLWGPMHASLSLGLTADLAMSAVVLYATLYIAGYEASYDAVGLTAPNLIFQPKTFPWDELVSIKDDGNHIYRLKFEGGTLSVQKYLVGMPTFLTFVSDIRKLNQRA